MVNADDLAQNEAAIRRAFEAAGLRGVELQPSPHLERGAMYAINVSAFAGTPPAPRSSVWNEVRH